ncbi:MAG: GNAT family N-acetyltransferase [Leptospirales bacterium]
MDFIDSREDCNPGIPNNDPPSNTIFRTDRLFFRNFFISDTCAVHQYASDPIVTEMTYWGPYNDSDTEIFIQNAINRSEEDPRILFDFAVISGDQGSPLLIGGSKLHITDRENREGEIGYYLERGSWKKGFATEIANALLQFGFDRLNLHRIMAMCFLENLASAHILEKVGMKKEGVLRQHRLNNGRWIDSSLYSILDQEWTKRQ